MQISAAVLAGGKSSRMGEDKAFLTLRGVPFVRMITDELKKTAGDVSVVIGKKERKRFESVVDSDIRIISDKYDLGNPMGGMLSACEQVRESYCAFVGCDTPLLKAGVIEYLARRAIGHSAALPIWETGDIEPLCSIYDVKETERAGLQALQAGKIGCKNLISYLGDPVYVEVNTLKPMDPTLVSFNNINLREDYEELKNLLKQ